MSWPEETTYNDVFPWEPPDKNLTPWEERTPEDTRAKADVIDNLYDEQDRQTCRGELRGDHLLLEEVAQAIAKAKAIVGISGQEERVRELVGQIDDFIGELALPGEIIEYGDKVAWFKDQIEKRGPRKKLTESSWLVSVFL